MCFSNATIYLFSILNPKPNIIILACCTYTYIELRVGGGCIYFYIHKVEGEGDTYIFTYIELRGGIYILLHL